MSHTFRQKSQVNAQTANPTTHNHTPGAAATVCVLTIVVAGAADRTGGAPTIDGTTATQVGTAINATECSIETWYVCKAFSGSLFSVSVPNAGANSISLEVVTADAGTGYSSAYNDFDEETQTGNVNGMTFTPSVNAVGDFVVSRVGSGEAAPASITCTYGTETYANDHGAYSSKGRYFIATGTGAQSIPWVWSSDDGCGQAVVFKSVVPTRTANLGVTLAGAVCAAAATLVATAALAVQLTGATVGSGATVPVVVDLGKTFAGATLSADATVDSGLNERFAALGVTLSGATVSAGGTVGIASALSGQLADASISAAGTAPTVAFLSMALSGAGLSADADAPVVASAGVSLDGGTLTSASTAPVVAAASVQLGEASVAATGAAGLGAVLAVDLDGASLSSGATVPVVAGAGISLSGAALASDLTVPVVAEAAVQLADATLSATASSTSSRAADLSVQLAGVGVTSGATVGTVADLSRQLGGASLESSATVACVASVGGQTWRYGPTTVGVGHGFPYWAVILDGLELSAAAVQGIVRTVDLSATLEGVALAAAGDVVITAASSVVLANSNVVSIATARRRAQGASRDGVDGSMNYSRKGTLPENADDRHTAPNVSRFRVGKTGPPASARNSTYKKSSQRGR